MYSSEKDWLDDDIADVHRIGRKDDDAQRPRPLLMKMVRGRDKRSLISSKTFRGKLKNEGMSVNDDLTSKQRDTLRQLREEGNVAFYRGTRLYSRPREQQTRHHSGQPSALAQGKERRATGKRTTGDQNDDQLLSDSWKYREDRPAHPCQPPDRVLRGAGCSGEGRGGGVGDAGARGSEGGGDPRDVCGNNGTSVSPGQHSTPLSSGHLFFSTRGRGRRTSGCSEESKVGGGSRGRDGDSGVRNTIHTPVGVVEHTSPSTQASDQPAFHDAEETAPQLSVSSGAGGPRTRLQARRTGDEDRTTAGGTQERIDDMFQRHQQR